MRLSDLTYSDEDLEKDALHFFKTQVYEPEYVHQVKEFIADDLRDFKQNYDNFEYVFLNIFYDEYQNGYIEIDGKKESVDFLKPFLQDYVNEVIADIKLKYPTRIAKIVLVGGGSILMHSAFKKHFPNCILIPNAQFSNAKGYYAIACSKFK